MAKKKTETAAPQANAQPAAKTFPTTTRSYNNFTNDSNIQRLLDRHYPAMLARQMQTLENFGAFASTKLDAQAAYSDSIAPATLKHELDNPTAPTKRIGKVYLNEQYKDCQQEIYRHGMLAKCFDVKQPEPHMLTFMAQYMTSYTDISTGCPLAMTHPNALILANRADDTTRKTFLPQFLRTDGKTMIGGTWATEWAGGSDIRGNTETEIDVLNGKAGKCYVNGRQYFASAIGFDNWGVIKTVQHINDETGKEGLALVFIPAYTDEKWDDAPDTREKNNINITHLKEKSGTKGLPTGEVEMTDAIGYMVADETQGLRAMMEALGCSRVHNAMAAAGVMHRAYNEALFWAANRDTFGGKLLTREDIQADLVHLKTEWLGGMALAFEAARSFDDALTDKGNAAWLRLATALAKYHTAEKATESTTRATEIIGGTGYTQDHPIERIHRDAMVLRVWEGPKNIQAREVMGMIKQGGAEAFSARMKEIAGSLPASMSGERKNIEHLAAKAASIFRIAKAANGLPAAQAPRVMEGLSKILTYALLCDEAAHELDLYQDQSKLFTAQTYYQNNDLAQLQMRKLNSPLQNEFPRMATGEVMPIAAPTKSTPKP